MCCALAKGPKQASTLISRPLSWNADENASKHVTLRYEALMHLLRTQSAQQESLEDLYRLRRAKQECGGNPAKAETVAGRQMYSSAANQLDGLCPIEAERLRGMSLCNVVMSLSLWRLACVCAFWFPQACGTLYQRCTRCPLQCSKPILVEQVRGRRRIIALSG